MSFLLPADFDDRTSTAIRPSVYQSHFKRLLDILGALALGVLVAPVVVFAALLIALDGHSPFHTQTRIGRHGRAFRMLKLRSMVPNAGEALQRHLAKSAAAQLEWDATQKLRRDPRITWIGRLLRKTSIDELPQLWNVLKGDLSLVGPRPLLPEQVVLYPGRTYFGAAPGLTGLWQVAARSDTSLPARARFDRLYAERVTLRGDVAILARTVGAVVHGTGC